jgi:hypothetical protein
VTLTGHVEARARLGMEVRVHTCPALFFTHATVSLIDVFSPRLPRSFIRSTSLGAVACHRPGPGVRLFIKVEENSHDRSRRSGDEQGAGDDTVGSAPKALESYCDLEVPGQPTGGDPGAGR